MSELNKARKEDLYNVALEMELDVQPSMTVVKMRELIKNSPLFEVEFINSLVRNQIAVREEEKQEALKEKQEALEEKRRSEELENRKLEMNFELEKLRLQVQNPNESSGAVGSNAAMSMTQPEAKIDVQRLLPTFNAETDDVSLFLVLLERQLKLSKVPEHLWVSHLLSVVPSSISTLIARESEENASSFPYVKDLLLKRFRISAERFRQMFFSHQKAKEITWRDYYFELRAYFENWLKELNISSFENLKDLILADQMKKRVPTECKNHMLDDWENLNSPVTLAEKLDAYDTIRTPYVKKDPVIANSKKESNRRDGYLKPVKPSHVLNRPRSPPRSDLRHKESSIACYGCGKPGFIRRKCPNCSMIKKENVHVQRLLLYSCNTSIVTAPNVPITICNKKVLVCADTGANRSIASERMYKLFQESGVSLHACTQDVTLADGITQATETLSATVPVDIEGRVFETEFIILPNARGNRTLLGMDFLQKANIVLDAANKTWYFSDRPRKRFNLIEEFDDSSTTVATAEVSAYTLREDEGKGLLTEQKERLNALLKNYEKCFQPGGEATPNVEHRINTGDNAPVAVPPYRITPKGLEVDSAKVEAIIKIPPPRTVKQVQSFLQTCSRYRRFIPKFADISRPICDLTKKKAVWRWGEAEQKSFKMLKECLITSPVLKQVDSTKPFILRTDASDYALGAVLSQGDDKTSEHPIEYASRLLTKSERNYSTTEREALAVIWALGKFRGYVEGQEITVASDHQPLKWLLSLKSPTGRLARWALQIQSYNLNIDYVPGKSNVVADMLSRPICNSQFGSEETCNFIGVDIPTRSPSSIREAQLSDENLKKIIDCFESDQRDENFVNWTERGYLMNQGILYRYSPDSDAEEAQLVIPAQEKESILKLHHDSPSAGHYGEEGTYQRIAQRYYWTGMRSYISEYVKKCPECCRYKANNQKPAGLLRTPVYAQRFETLSMDLFGPLPASKDGYRWILIAEDCATKWVELFPLISATAHECAKILIEEVFFRYGIPRKLISDNGPQFVSAVLQQVCCTLDIDQNLTPVYHPQANPVERKNRDLKPRLAILVGNDHDSWVDKLPSIRFALNTAKSDTTGHTAAYLQFGRELRTIDDIAHDLKAVLDNDNFVPEITPYLNRLATIMKIVKERVEMKQDQRKIYYDKNRRKVYFTPGEKVWVTLHPVSKADQKKTSKFMPKRDGPYLILTQRSPVTYEIASIDNPTQKIGNYHVSALKPFQEVETSPVVPLRRRGRPPKKTPVSSTRRKSETEGENVTHGEYNNETRKVYNFRPRVFESKRELLYNHA